MATFSFSRMLIVHSAKTTALQQLRNHSSLNNQIKKSVFISQSNDIFTNLALEDWLYKNYDFSQHHVLMLWKNDPCVVIGRHQNPWLEANLASLAERGVALARRNSGGGTVYHDHGNLNMTFFTSKERYNRRYNLELIVRALFREWGIKSEISSREDIMIRGNYKQVSGTAAKLGRPNAYHHCTLLVNANKVDLSEALRRVELGIKSNATQSIRSPIINLCEDNSDVTVNKLLEAVGKEYLRTSASSLTDGGFNQINNQHGFQLINPTEEWFPGLNKIREEFTNWNWIYGKTPKFSIVHTFTTLNSNNRFVDLKISLQVLNGKIDDITINIPPGLSSCGFHGDASVISDLKGTPFNQSVVTTLKNLMSANIGKESIITESVRHVM